MADCDCLIWSFERGAWWAPEGTGYVVRQAQAGLYSLGRALEIVREANVAALNEAIVPVPDVRLITKRTEMSSMPPRGFLAIDEERVPSPPRDRHQRGADVTEAIAHTSDWSPSESVLRDHGYTFYSGRLTTPGVHEPCFVPQPLADGWDVFCSCGQWGARVSLYEVPEGVGSGSGWTIERLRQKHEAHRAQVVRSPPEQ
jgi:hypothetical protein